MRRPVVVEMCEHPASRTICFAIAAQAADQGLIYFKKEKVKKYSLLLYTRRKTLSDGMTVDPPLGLDSHERQLAGKTARRTLGHNRGYEERDK